METKKVSFKNNVHKVKKSTLTQGFLFQKLLICSVILKKSGKTALKLDRNENEPLLQLQAT